ncbi:MAG: AhpC/TSA family protein [Flavobacterium sp.]|nr:MAG: AhpC/TSA family protein [Flavobacterium sp.]
MRLREKIIALMIAMPLLSMAQGNEQYVLKGTVKGIADGEVALSSYDPRTRVTTKVSTAIVKNGMFEFTGKQNAPDLMSLNFTPGNWGTSIFIENGALTIAIDTMGAQHYDNTKYGSVKGARLSTVKISGSQSQIDYDGYSKVSKGVKNKEEMNSRQLDYIQNFIANKPSSSVGAYLLSNYLLFNSQMSLTKLDELMAGFKGEATKSLHYSNLQTEIKERKAVLPGNQAEDFTLLKPDSTKFTLSSLRGKYVLIDFWASWCVPCREAIPHWKEVYSKYKDKGFEIVGVTNDSKWSDWKEAMAVEKMPWIQVADEFPIKNMRARVIGKYKHGTIPLYVLIDKTGKILAKTGDKQIIDQKLKELFN